MRNVLLPHDLSADDDLVVRFAAGLPALGTRRVVVAHTIEASGMEGPVIHRKTDNARARLQSVAGILADAGLETDVLVRTGDPYEEMLAAAREESVNGIVLGTTAKRAVSELIVGSVSERVVRDATVPSLVVRYSLLRNAAEPAELARRFAERLLVPTDFSENATRGVEAALDLPSKSVSSAYLLHVLDAAMGEERRKTAEASAGQRLREWADTAAERGIPAIAVVRVGDAWREVLAEIDERRASGVVIGTRGRGALQEALMGNLAMTLLRQASCPVLIVP